MFRKITTAVAVALFAAPAIADTKLQYVDEKSDAPQSSILIKDGKVRMNNADSSSWTLYDSATNTLTTINPDDQTYTVMDEETMKNVSGQMSEAMAEMQREMEKMSPEQRAMMEKMMGGALDAGKKMIETRVDRTGKKLDKAGYSCEQVFYSVGTLGRSELCVVDINKLDIPADDRRALEAMQAQMKVVAENVSKGLGVNLAFDFDSLGGMPVYMKEDKERSGDILEDVSHSSIDASQLKIPAGYSEEKIQAGE